MHPFRPVSTCTHSAQLAHCTHSAHSPIYEEVGYGATVAPRMDEKVTWAQLCIRRNSFFWSRTHLELFVSHFCVFRHSFLQVFILRTWCRMSRWPSTTFRRRNTATPALVSPLLLYRYWYPSDTTKFTKNIRSTWRTLSNRSTGTYIVLSRGVRSLFGSTRKSSPWGNFSDGGWNQSIKPRLSL